VDKCIIEGWWWWYSETSEIIILCSKQTQRPFWSVLPCSKKHFIWCLRPNACQCMLANCGANTRRPVWSAYVLHITLPIELCITYPEMSVFAHTRLAIVPGPLMPCWETTCIEFLCDAHLHPTFLFDRFKCLMFFTNLYFSSIIHLSCMVESECSSCSWVVCGHCVHTKHKQK